jgi:hypothetical protein
MGCTYLPSQEILILYKSFAKSEFFLKIFSVQRCFRKNPLTAWLASHGGLVANGLSNFINFFVFNVFAFFQLRCIA